MSWFVVELMLAVAIDGGLPALNCPHAHSKIAASIVMFIFVMVPSCCPDVASSKAGGDATRERRAPPSTRTIPDEGSDPDPGLPFPLRAGYDDRNLVDRRVDGRRRDHRKLLRAPHRPGTSAQQDRREYRSLRRHRSPLNALEI
jgi:hypothetical protein